MVKTVSWMGAALLLVGCSGAGDARCPDGSDLLRCRVEASDDPELRRALAPLLAQPESGAASAGSDHE